MKEYTLLEGHIWRSQNMFSGHSHSVTTVRMWRGGEPAHGEKVWGQMTPPKHYSVEVKPKYHISVPCFENVSCFLSCSEYLPHFQPASPIPSVATCFSTRGAYSLRTLWFSAMALRVKLEGFWAGKDSSHLVYPHSFIERATEHQSEQGQNSREFLTEAELNSFLIHRLPLKLTFPSNFVHFSSMFNWKSNLKKMPCKVSGNLNFVVAG